MGILIPWPEKDKTKAVLTPEEQLFNMYREARIQQGWEEFKWTSLSETQKYVWKLVIVKLQGG